MERFQDGLKTKALRSDLDRIEAAMVKVFMKEDDKVAEEIQADCIKTVFNRDAGEIIFFCFSSTARDYLIAKINALNIKGLKARGRRATPPNLQVEVPASMPGRPEQYLESALRRAVKITAPKFQCVKVREPNAWGARIADCILEEAHMLKLQSWAVDTGAQALPFLPVELRFWLLHPKPEKTTALEKADTTPMDTAMTEEETPREAAATATKAPATDATVTTESKPETAVIEEETPNDWNETDSKWEWRNKAPAPEEPKGTPTPVPEDEDLEAELLKKPIVKVLASDEEEEEDDDIHNSANKSLSNIARMYGDFPEEEVKDLLADDDTAMNSLDVNDTNDAFTTQVIKNLGPNGSSSPRSQGSTVANSNNTSNAGMGSSVCNSTDSTNTDLMRSPPSSAQRTKNSEPNGSNSPRSQGSIAANCTNTNNAEMGTSIGKGLTPPNFTPGLKFKRPDSGKSMDIRVLLAKQAANAAAATTKTQSHSAHLTNDPKVPKAEQSPKGPTHTQGSLRKTPLPPKTPKRGTKQATTGSIAMDRPKRECTKPARRALMLAPSARYS